MISMDKNGGRTIHLFIPFEYKNKKVETITLSAPCLGHALRWTEGDWSSAIALLVELAGVDEAIIRSLRYPDADRVMDQFLTMLPPDIRTDIADGRIPVKSGLTGTPEEQLAEVTAKLEAVTAQAQARAAQVNGGEAGQRVNMQGPGVPLPQEGEVGFDLSDEP
jgi:hypothetical protein